MTTPGGNFSKPLPALPQHSFNAATKHIKALTVDSSGHITGLINHLLEDDDSLRADDKDAWCDALHAALDGLVDAAVLGEWLADIKRAKVRRRSDGVDAALEKKQVQERSKASKDAEARKGKGSQVQNAENDDRIRGDEEESQAVDRRLQEQQHQILALRQLRSFTSKPGPSTPRPSAKHLLLTVATFDEQTGSYFKAADVLSTPVRRCVFAPNAFSLPDPDPSGDVEDLEAASPFLLFGLREWTTSADATSDNLSLVGGTFFFEGVRSANEHASLTRILRIAVYTRLSVMLEQQLLAQFQVGLRFPKPPSPPLPSAPTVPMIHRLSSPDARRRSRDSCESHLPSSIWSFFSKKTNNLLHRASTVAPSLVRRGSLDFPQAPHTPPVAHRGSAEIPASSSLARRFSIFGDSRSSTSQQPDKADDPPFQSTLQRLERDARFLSTSPGLIVSMPILLLRLAEEEKANPTRRLRGEERTGLMSLLGWEGREARGRGMVGPIGFARQQSLSVLCSKHVVGAAVSIENTNKSVFLDEDQNPYSYCGSRARWRTFVFYGRDEDTLGEVVEDHCANAKETCTESGCGSLRRQHELRWVHNAIRIVAKTREESGEPNDGVEIWQSCKVCSASTPRRTMSDATYLYSFAKFLELLVYSPTLCTLSPTLCSHTVPPPKPWTGPDFPLPQSRFNIIRHFKHKSHTISFSLSIIHDIFELRPPRLQYSRGNGGERPAERDKERSTSPAAIADAKKAEADEEKRALRREIKNWWQGVAEHLDKLELHFLDNVSVSSHYHKSLPRLPSVDDAYETQSETATPKAGQTSLPRTEPPSPLMHGADSSFTSATTVRPQFSRASSTTSLPKSTCSDSEEPSDHLSLLSNMRYNFQQKEQELYHQLSQTPVSTINDVRRSFHDAARGSMKRLSAWEDKHVAKPAKPELDADRQAIPTPEWWRSGYHAVPGGNVIIREEDWGSIIAFTLSSMDYQRELVNMSLPRGAANQNIVLPTTVASARPSGAATPSPAASSGSTLSFKLFASSTKPDPDRDDSAWQESEPCSAFISRKEHPRDPTTLMSRNVLRHAIPVPADAGSNIPSSSLAHMNTPAGRNVSGGAPPLAWAKPAVMVNMEPAGGKVTAHSESKAEKMLQEMDAASVASSRNGSDAEGSSFLETNIRRGTSSVISNGSTIRTASTPEGPSAPPTPPLKDIVSALPEPVAPRIDVMEPSPSSAKANVEQSARQGGDLRELPPTPATPSWTNSLTNAMRYVLSTADPNTRTSPAPLQKHHGLLSNIDPLTIDDRPHIKYDWTIGKRLKFGCTVYYAKQFDALRRRCGVDDVFLKSMMKCEMWMAEGGKSKSNFWKTADNRFIIKTLVNAWNVADLQVLIDIAPHYFRHMETTAGKASLLAKLLGFYTVEVKNLETGNVQAKADLLVMENLFYNQKITKTFDLKGIQGRKVKPSSSTSKILFDGEWIEDQQRTLTLILPHSKTVLHEGLKSDCEFLAKSNIMDYSLLVGVDEENRQNFCGLVDTIGSYTFAKTLEYKAKQGFLSKEVTVVPPQEYQERFMAAMDRYFIACPDKWTKPPDEKKLPRDPSDLPSVL